MNWYEEPATPVPEPAPPATPTGGWRRGVATIALAAGLVLVGGAAVVSAASPDPSASPAPGATTQPPTTQPSNPGTTPRTHTGKNCPNMGGSGGSGGQTPNASPDASPNASSSNT